MFKRLKSYDQKKIKKNPTNALLITQCGDTVKKRFEVTGSQLFLLNCSQQNREHI